MMFKRSNTNKSTLKKIAIKIKNLEKSQMRIKQQINDERRFYQFLLFTAKRYFLILAPLFLRGFWFLIFKAKEIIQNY